MCIRDSNRGAAPTPFVIAESITLSYSYRSFQGADGGALTSDTADAQTHHPLSVWSICVVILTCRASLPFDHPHSNHTKICGQPPPSYNRSVVAHLWRGFGQKANLIRGAAPPNTPSQPALIHTGAALSLLTSLSLIQASLDHSPLFLSS